jgi:hypothetical protein
MSFGSATLRSNLLEIEGMDRVDGRIRRHNAPHRSPFPLLQRKEG